MGRILNLQTFHRGKRLLISRNYHLTRKSLSIVQFFFHPNQITFHITESGSLSFDCNINYSISCVGCLVRHEVAQGLYKGF